MALCDCILVHGCANSCQVHNAMLLNIVSAIDTFDTSAEKPAANSVVKKALVRLGNPLLQFLIMLVLIFMAELLVMAALHFLPPQEPVTEVV